METTTPITRTDHLLPAPHHKRAIVGLVLAGIAVVLSVSVFFFFSFFGTILAIETLVAVTGLVYSILALKHEVRWMGIVGIVINSIAILFVITMFALGLIQGAYLMGFQACLSGTGLGL